MKQICGWMFKSEDTFSIRVFPVKEFQENCTSWMWPVLREGSRFLSVVLTGENSPTFTPVVIVKFPRHSGWRLYILNIDPVTPTLPELFFFAAILWRLWAIDGSDESVLGDLSLHVCPGLCWDMYQWVSDCLLINAAPWQQIRDVW